MTEVFVGIPTLNRPQLVRETIASLRAQTFADWRAVVSDNVSEPSAVEDVRRYIKSLDDPRLRFVQQSVNGGEYGQGRFFLSEATEPYFMILHDDDVLEPTYLERAVTQLKKTPAAAFFVANPLMIRHDGTVCPRLTKHYLNWWKRSSYRAGFINVLDSHMDCGFAPISATCFRTAALRASGFVDDLEGCFPFESNVFLRLGECGMTAWFCDESLVRFRVHDESLSFYHHLESELVLTRTIKLMERRRFTGRNERRRRQILGRLYRHLALLHIRRGEGHPQQEIRRALASNPTSVKNWMLQVPVHLALGLMRRCLPPTGEERMVPKIRVSDANQAEHLLATDGSATSPVSESPAKQLEGMKT